MDLGVARKQVSRAAGELTVPTFSGYAMPAEWLPHALVLVGHPDPAYVARQRPPVPLDDLRATR